VGKDRCGSAVDCNNCRMHMAARQRFVHNLHARELPPGVGKRHRCQRRSQRPTLRLVQQTHLLPGKVDGTECGAGAGGEQADRPERCGPGRGKGQGRSQRSKRGFFASAKLRLSFEQADRQMACGLPVFSTDVAGQELIRENQIGQFGRRETMSSEFGLFLKQLEGCKRYVDLHRQVKVQTRRRH